MPTEIDAARKSVKIASVDVGLVMGDHPRPLLLVCSEVYYLSEEETVCVSDPDWCECGLCHGY